MVFQIVLAGNAIEIETRYRHIAEMHRDFMVEGPAPILKISASEAEMDEVWRRRAVKPTQKRRSYRIGMGPVFERQVIYDKICECLPDFSAMLMHGVVVSDGASAYMFTAPSGTGKSTRGRIFTELYPEFFILNGDKPIIRVEEDRVVACGSPWKGKEGEGVNAEAPLKAIFLLERSNHTELTELTLSEAFDFLVRQTYLPTDGLRSIKTMKLLKSFEGKVRIFRFLSTPTADSVEAAYRAALTEKRKD